MAKSSMRAVVGIGDFKASEPPKFCLPLFWIKFKSSKKNFWLGGGCFAWLKTSKPARRLA